MEQSPSETNSYSVRQEIPSHLWNPKFRYCVHTSALVPRSCVTFHNKLLFFTMRIC